MHVLNYLQSCYLFFILFQTVLPSLNRNASGTSVISATDLAWSNASDEPDGMYKADDVIENVSVDREFGNADKITPITETLL